MRSFLSELDEFANEHQTNTEMTEFVEPLRRATQTLREAFDWLMEAAQDEPAAPSAAAVDFLRLMGMTSLAYMWAGMAAKSLENLEGDNTGFYAAKLDTGRYFMRRLLPQTSALADAVRSGSDLLMALDAETF